jgi:hypothetical protein
MPSVCLFEGDVKVSETFFGQIAWRRILKSINTKSSKRDVSKKAEAVVNVETCRNWRQVGVEEQQDDDGEDKP